MSGTLTFRCPACGALNHVAPGRVASGPTCGRCKAPLDPSGTPVDLDDDQLTRLVRSADVPVLVDFWAAWCGPCRAVAPHLAALAKAHAGRLIVAKVDVDRHKRTAGELGVQGIPTLAVYQGGRLAKVEAGARTGPALKAWVAPFLQG